MRLLLVNVEMNWSEPLTAQDRIDASDRLADILQRAKRRGLFQAAEMRERGQKLMSILVHPRLYPPPENGHEAFKYGFWLRENPYPPGTADHDRWRLEWRRRM